MADAMTTEQDVAKQTVEQAEHGVQRLKEGEPTRAAAEVQESVPSVNYAYFAGGSILASVLLFLFRKREAAIFVGLWPPTFFSMALFYKLLKPSREIR
jgi:hypothetical protein